MRFETLNVRQDGAVRGDRVGDGDDAELPSPRVPVVIGDSVEQVLPDGVVIEVDPVPSQDGQRRPSGMNSSIGRSYHASALYCSNTPAALSISAVVRIASPQEVQSSAGIGTPHAR